MVSSGFSGCRGSVWLIVDKGSANVEMNSAEGGRHGVVEEAKGD